MSFDINNYLQQLKNPSTRSYAEDSLEFAIKRAPIEQAIELKKLRTPPVVAGLEIKRLKVSGFDFSTKNINGVDEDWLLLSFHARWEHAKKYWPEEAEYYSMADYPLCQTEVAA